MLFALKLLVFVACLIGIPLALGAFIHPWVGIAAMVPAFLLTQPICNKYTERFLRSKE